MCQFVVLSRIKPSKRVHSIIQFGGSNLYLKTPQRLPDILIDPCQRLTELYTDFQFRPVSHLDKKFNRFSHFNVSMPIVLSFAHWLLYMEAYSSTVLKSDNACMRCNPIFFNVCILMPVWRGSHPCLVADQCLFSASKLKNPSLYKLCVCWERGSFSF